MNSMPWKNSHTSLQAVLRCLASQRPRHLNAIALRCAALCCAVLHKNLPQAGRLFCSLRAWPCQHLRLGFQKHCTLATRPIISSLLYLSQLGLVRNMKLCSSGLHLNLSVVIARFELMLIQTCSTSTVNPRKRELRRTSPRTTKTCNPQPKA